MCALNVKDVLTGNDNSDILNTWKINRQSTVI